MAIRRAKTSLFSYQKNYGLVSAKIQSIIGATGGSISISGGYTIHQFTSSSSFVLNNGPIGVEFIVISGGGGGNSGGGGGGGAGGLISSSSTIDLGSLKEFHSHRNSVGEIPL